MLTPDGASFTRSQKGIEKKSGEKKALSGYMKYCAEKRAEWKKAGKVVPVPEQGKTL